MQKRLYDTWGGQTQRSAEAATKKKKARRSTSCVIVRLGGKSDTRSQRDRGHGTKERKHRRNIGKWRRGITSHSLRPSNRERLEVARRQPKF